MSLGLSFGGPVAEALGLDGEHHPTGPGDAVTATPTGFSLRGPDRLALDAGNRWRFAFDIAACIGCHSCEVACGEQNGLPATTRWRRVGELEAEAEAGARRFHVSMACNHCTEPACLAGCPTNAYVTLASGIVAHQASECIGCQYCTWTCPYEVPVFQPDRRIVTKCDLCQPRLSAGLEPACAAACPTKAITVEQVPVAGLGPSDADRNLAQVLHLPDPSLTGSTTRVVAPPLLQNAAEPVVTRAGNHGAPRPEHAHLPLVWLTLLSQIAVGISLAAVVRGGGAGEQNPARAAAALASLALAGSLLHLGKPLRAWKAVRNLRRSWLSREVVLLGGYATVAVGAALLPLATDRTFLPQTIGAAGRATTALIALSAVVGLAGVGASAMLYRVPGRPTWHSWRTVAAFYAVSALTSGFVLVLRNPDSVVLAWGLVLLVAAHLLLRLSHWHRIAGRLDAASREAVSLLRGALRPSATARVLLAVTAVIAVTVAARRRSADDAQVAVLTAGAITLLASELIGRILFYRTAVPTGMPGSFSRGRR
jgi:formate dehydrogenase iron-sulfur subunit